MFFRRQKPKPKRRQPIVPAPLRRRAVDTTDTEVAVVHARLQASEPLMLIDDKSLGFDPYNSKDKT